MQKHEERIPVSMENEGMKLYGMLHKPIGVTKYPVVLICHGLAGHKTGKYRLYVKLAQSLTQQGIGALRFDFRGSGDSEGDFTETRVDGMLSDAMVALRFLENHSEIETTKIGLFGRSFGGAIAIMAAALFANIKSIALWAPMYNASQWLHRWNMAQTAQLDEKTLEKLMVIDGQLASLPFFEQFFTMELESSFPYLENIPLLHLHGTSDQIVNISHAQLYKHQRHKAQADSEFIELLNADHDFSQLEDQHSALKLTTDWFVSTLR